MNLTHGQYLHSKLAAENRLLLGMQGIKPPKQMGQDKACQIGNFAGIELLGSLFLLERPFSYWLSQRS
jgi:hypothetical protein